MVTQDDYAVIIPTYKRCGRVITYNKLRESGYTGRIYLLVGDDDPEQEQYKSKYPDEVVMFSKDKIAPDVDMVDNFRGKNCVVYARNAMWLVAKDLGLKYFLVLDDDYTRFNYRRIFGNQLLDIKVRNLDNALNACFTYLSNTKRLDCFALAQNGDYIGGANAFENIGKKRKMMNAYFFKVDVPVSFMGRINEDLSASVYHSQRGKLFWTINDMSIAQVTTQGSSGGLTELYLDMGTYVKSFYSVVVAPNCVKVSVMGNSDMRLHHRVNWNGSAPKLIREEWKSR